MATHPIKPASTLCPSAWRPNPGRVLHLAMRKISSENRDHYSLWLNERGPLTEAAFVSVRFAPGLFSFVDEPFPDFCDLK